MSTLEVIAPTNQILTASLYAKGSDTVTESLNLTENVNSKGIYRGTVTGALSGNYKVIVYLEATPVIVTDAIFDGSSVIYAADLTLSNYQTIANTVWSNTARTVTGGTIDSVITIPPVTVDTQEIANTVWLVQDRSLTDKANFTLTNVYDAAKTASQFNPSTDTVAHVTLVDTTTNLTANVSVDLTSIDAAIANLNSQVADIYNRIIFQVPDGPAVLIPAPSSNNSTLAWAYCYDELGRPVAGTIITLKLIETCPTTTRKGSFLSQEFTTVSNQYGIATTEIPRGSIFKFRVKSGRTGSWIEFRGTDDEQLELPFLVSKNT